MKTVASAADKVQINIRNHFNDFVIENLGFNIDPNDGYTFGFGDAISPSASTSTSSFAIGIHRGKVRSGQSHTLKPSEKIFNADSGAKKPGLHVASGTNQLRIDTATKDAYHITEHRLKSAQIRIHIKCKAHAVGVDIDGVTVTTYNRSMTEFSEASSPKRA